MAAFSEMLVGVHDEICEILVASPTALTSFTGKLFSHKIVDRQTKQEVFRIDGYRGASTLLDCIELKIKSNPQRFDVIVDIMEQVEPLRDVREKMVRIKSSCDQENENPQVIQIAKAPLTCDATLIAKHLKTVFDDLLVTINGGIKGVDVADLRLRITWFLKSDHPGKLLEDKCPCELDSCVTAQAILLCLVKANLIGHINYKLLEVFVKASGNNPTLKASIEAYEQEYMKLFKCNFSSIMEVFRDPVLTSIPPVSLPDFKIRLGTKWEESNIYSLKEAFERKFPWAEHLVILDVTKNRVLIKYGVLPFFISAVVRDLTDPTVIEELKREDITIELSPELLKYSSLPAKESRQEYNIVVNNEVKEKAVKVPSEDEVVDYKQQLAEKDTKIMRLQQELDNKASEILKLEENLTKKKIKLKALEELETRNKELEAENEMLDRENDDQADTYCKLKKENDELKKLLKEYGIHPDLDIDSDPTKERVFQSTIINNMPKFTKYTDL